MQKITLHLWFYRDAKEAAELYVSLFPGSIYGPLLPI